MIIEDLINKMDHMQARVEALEERFSKIMYIEVEK